jgi:hypothetical protein
MAAAIRGGDVKGTILHFGRVSDFAALPFGQACGALRAAQSMGSVGFCFDKGGRRELALDPGAPGITKALGKELPSAQHGPFRHKRSG